MGGELLALAPEFDFEVVGGVARGGKSIGGVATVEHPTQLDSANAEVVIDFSMPELTAAVTSWCADRKVPLVSGVTGLSAEEKSLFMKIAKTTPVLWSPNMSLGIAVMSRMLAEFSRLDGFQFQIEELHHIRKKDKPSGTAIHLQQKLKEAVGEDVPAPLAIRGGGIFGIHRAWAMGEEEMITLEHNAMNRRVFARGALKAADWLLDQQPGLYAMDDVLG
jgi:4-hydroxy-tetrahydrodipicolinate reductase